MSCFFLLHCPRCSVPQSISKDIAMNGKTNVATRFLPMFYTDEFYIIFKNDHNIMTNFVIMMTTIIYVLLALLLIMESIGL